jgi:glycosyltransferase involved in cell wall biosynthesis
MHLFINALAATAGGGITYVRNVLPHLSVEPGINTTVALGPDLCHEFGSLPNVRFLQMEIPVARRFWYEQSTLPSVTRDHQADVLLSAGNFALRRSPVPQVLLSRNSIYLSPDFYRDLWSRDEYRLLLDTRIRAIFAKRSIRWADVTVAPSHAFARELERWSGKKVVAIHHGFNNDAFTQDPTPLSSEVQTQLDAAADSVKILFVSHYNYYRNFETLIRALPLLRDALAPRSFKLLLTSRLQAGENPGAYSPTAAADLIRKLRVQDFVVELGSIPYPHVHQLYASADVYVTPAYTETFAHPLVEAMAAGLPVVGSDLPVHREICGDAAMYFPKFAPEQLAQAIAKVLMCPDLAKRMAAAGVIRSQQFSWKSHVRQILDVCERAIQSRKGQVLSS